MAGTLLALDGLAKQYGRHRVLDDVSFTLGAGETAALLGENGAGKSTLAKMLAGAVRPDAGHLRIDGEEVSFSTPREALTHGIAFIPQELVYVPQLTVAENIVLGRWPQRAGVTSQAQVRRQAAAEARRYGFQLPLNRTMTALPLAQQQMVEILKAVARRSRIIVLDEPTAALNSEDSQQLLDLMTALAGEGVGVIYISHRLDEVFRACHTVHVLRNGRLVHSSGVAETSPGQIVAHMLGRSTEEAVVPKQRQDATATVLQVRDWERKATPPLRGVSLDVHKGEIVGLYGVRGAGAETVAETLGGLHPDVRGHTTVAGRALRGLRHPIVSRRAGIAYVPADRKSQGLVLTLPVQHSFSLLVLRSLARRGVVAQRRERATARQLASRVRLRARGLGQAAGEQVNDCVRYFYSTIAPLLGLPEVDATTITPKTTTIGSNAVQFDGGSQLQPSFEAVKNLLPSIPRDHNIVLYTVNNDSTSGALRALEDAGRGDKDKLLIGGLGGDETGIKALREDPRWVAEGDIFVSWWGEYAVAMAQALAKGQTPPSDVTALPQVVLDKESVDQYHQPGSVDVKQLPPLEASNQYLREGGFLQVVGNIEGL